MQSLLVYGDKRQVAEHSLLEKLLRHFVREVPLVEVAGEHFGSAFEDGEVHYVVIIDVAHLYPIVIYCRVHHLIGSGVHLHITVIFLVVEEDYGVAFEEFALVYRHRLLLREHPCVTAVGGLHEFYALPVLVYELEDMGSLPYYLVFQYILSHKDEGVGLYPEVDRDACGIREEDGVALHAKNHIVGLVVKPDALQTALCLFVITRGVVLFGVTMAAKHCGNNNRQQHCGQCLSYIKHKLCYNNSLRAHLGDLRLLRFFVSCSFALLKDPRLGKLLAVEVLLTRHHVSRINGPVDCQRLVVPTDACLLLRRIDIVHLIGEDGLVAQHEEAVGKATGNEELAFVLVAQLHHDMLAERGRTLPQVDSHIEHSALYHSHQLRLREVALLIVQPAQHAVRRARLVVLHEINLAYIRFKLVFLPRFKKIAPAVSKHLGVDNPHAFNGSFRIRHNNISFIHKDSASESNENLFLLPSAAYLIQR